MSKPTWDKKWGQNARCAITQARLRPGRNKKGVPYTITLPCNHRFYRSALQTWIEKLCEKSQTPSCPLCRKRIYLIDLTTQKS